jgi:hypothetical protein
MTILTFVASFQFSGGCAPKILFTSTVNGFIQNVMAMEITCLLEKDQQRKSTKMKDKLLKD